MGTFAQLRRERVPVTSRDAARQLC
jgi:hypothetical protein